MYHILCKLYISLNIFSSIYEELKDTLYSKSLIRHAIAKKPFKSPIKMFTKICLPNLNLQMLTKFE